MEENGGNMTEIITKINASVNAVVWGMPVLVLIIAIGMLMTVLTGFFQFRYIRHWMENTIGSIFHDKHVTAHTEKGDSSISQFQSMCIALAATLGTGSIVGVATALVCGGPGAVFWMWITALLGMMTGFAEKVLGIYYRQKNAKGEWCGGAMYYLKEGLGSRKHCRLFGTVLAVLFALFCLLASFGIGNMSQINSIAGNMQEVFGIAPIQTGLILMVLAGVIIVGGLKRVAVVAEKLVPFMAVAYIIGTLVIFFANIEKAPAVFTAIIKGAFGMKAAGGGIVGRGMQMAVSWGIKRGVFSNEAGLGTSVLVHSNSNVKEPVQQGMWGIFEIFMDTIVVCTLTAFAILSSGVVNLRTGEMISEVPASGLVGEAFSTVFGDGGPAFIAVAVLFFAFTTVLGWSQYGVKVFEYLFGTKAVLFYKLAFVAMILCGATMNLELVWDLSDTFNGLMAVPNLIGLLVLSPAVYRITQNYINRKIWKKTEKPLLSAYEEIQKQQEAELG